MNGDNNGFLYQCRHREYDPVAGRWLSRDPAGFVDGMNLYQYCAGRALAAIDASGRSVAKAEVLGAGLAMETRHRVLIFFVGIGKDADMEIGRVLAEATGATFEGVAEKDLASVLEAFGRYF